MTWHVLLIEDDDDARETLAVVLSGRGFRVTTARNGADALRDVRERALRPAVILLDLVMPLMDGHAFLAAQAEEPLLADVPVIVVSSETHVPAVAPPVRAIVSKPIALQELLRHIRGVVADSPA